MRGRCWAGLVAACCLTAGADGVISALRVPEGFVVERAAGPPLSSYPMFLAFDDAGRLYIAESSGLNLSGQAMADAPGCFILRLVDRDGDGVYDERTVFADKLSLPMGVLWHEGALYVASPPEFLRFADKDGDGVAEERAVIHSGWNVKNTASLHGPFLGPDGFMYLTHGRHGYKIATKEGPVLEGTAARIWRCLPDGGRLERFCGGGFDNPVELIWMDGGELIGTMTYYMDPRNGQRDALMHWVEGGVYPKPHECVAEFARTGDLMPTMSKFARIAPAGLARVSGTGLDADYAGSLFSAQFNPSRVQRHRIHADGATFRTEDEDFLTSSNPHFHPTDVIEDIDGTLLVSDTGGWYVDACPISRVARPEYFGGIYRVRRADHARPANAWDAVAPLRAMDADGLVRALDDPRPLVHEAAREILARPENGAARKKAMAGTVRQRLAGVWASGRSGAMKDRARLRDALDDSAPEVRAAAAHMAGLYPGPDLGASLAALLRDPEPGVRREAATALGRAGDASAAPALLAACKDGDDRFLEHALIYALIQLRAEDALIAGLADAAPGVRKAAVIALDQTGSARLNAESVVPLLAAPDAELRRAALWVASHHPDWADTVAAHLRGTLAEEAASPEAAAGIREILFAYAASPGVQALAAESLSSLAPDSPWRELLVDLLANAAVSPYPAAWEQTVAALLDSAATADRWAALRIIRTRSLPHADDALRAIGQDAGTPADLRLAALAAALPRHAELSADAFAFVTGLVDATAPPPLRQAAAEILRGAALSGAQREHIARNILPKADALVFAPLLDGAARGGGMAAGSDVVHALLASPVAEQSLTSERLDQLLQGFPEDLREAAAPLRARLDAAREARVLRLEALAPRLGGGDVGRGRRVFFSEKAACHTCHAIGEEGGRLGPDLTTVGLIRSELDLLEAVLFPSASQVPGYESYRVEARDPEFGGAVVHEGLLGEEDAAAIQIKTAVDATVRVPRADLISMTPHPVSKMPENLDAALSEPDLIDLIAFLRSLNNEQWLLPEQRETGRTP